MIVNTVTVPAGEGKKTHLPGLDGEQGFAQILEKKGGMTREVSVKPDRNVAPDTAAAPLPLIADPAEQVGQQEAQGAKEEQELLLPTELPFSGVLQPEELQHWMMQFAATVTTRDDRTASVSVTSVADKRLQGALPATVPAARNVTEANLPVSTVAQRGLPLPASGADQHRVAGEPRTRSDVDSRLLPPAAGEVKDVVSSPSTTASAVSVPVMAVAEARPREMPETIARPLPVAGVEGNTQADAVTLSDKVTPTLHHPLGSAQWQQSLGQHLTFFTRQGIHNAELRLHPEELGSLQITLRLTQDQAQLHVLTENPQVRVVLEAAMPHLRASLAESGIQLGQSSVDNGSTSSGDTAQPASDALASATGGEEGSEDEKRHDVVIDYQQQRVGINTFV